MASAPGSLSLLGEDVGHGQGLVLGAATRERVKVVAAVRTDRRAFLRSAETAGEVALSLDRPERTWGWTDHVAAAALALEREGLKLGGFEMLFEGDIPSRIGLGSSAALESAAVAALDALHRFGLNGLQKAAICRRGQEEFLGLAEPLTAAAVSSASREGHLIVVDEGEMRLRLVEAEMRGHAFVVIDSGLRLPASETELARVREQTHRALDALRQKRQGLERLRDVSAEELESLEAPLAARARRVLSEARRVAIAVEALEAGEIERLGALMTESHDSLRLHAGVQPPELDSLVRMTQTAPGVMGARLMREGSVTGVVALALTGSIEDLKARLETNYFRKFGRQSAWWTVERPGAGAEAHTLV